MEDIVKMINKYIKEILKVYIKGLLILHGIILVVVTIIWLSTNNYEYFAVLFIIFLISCIVVAIEPHIPSGYKGVK